MDNQAKSNVVAFNQVTDQINLKKGLVEEGINNDIAANIAHLFIFKLSKDERIIVAKKLVEILE